MIPSTQQRTIGYLGLNILLGNQPTRIEAMIVGTHGPYDLVLDSHKTKHHCASNGFPDGLQIV